MTAERRGKYAGRVYADHGDQFRRLSRHVYGSHVEVPLTVMVGHPSSHGGEREVPVHPAVLRLRAQINWHAYHQARR